MIKQLSIGHLSQDLENILNLVKHYKDDIVVLEEGKPIAAIVNFELFEKFQALRKELEQLTKEIGKAHGQNSQGLPPQMQEVLQFIQGNL
jgi:PHD/YefM family antitoxin component YafN of YafNO toxin-antitoxin module